MKLNKIFAIAVALLAFTSCSDDDDTQYNTNGNVTVAMKESTMTVDEFTTDDVVNIPIVVNGTANGMIKVNLVVNATGSTGAVEDKDYYVTSKTIYIPDTKKEGNMEIAIVNNRFKEADRTFTVSIVSAEGATVAQNGNSTLVTIADDDATLYGRLQGKWTFKAQDGFTDEGDEVSFRCNITGLRASDLGYGQYLFLEFPGSLGSAVWTNSVRCQIMELPEPEDGVIALLAVPLGQNIGTNIPYPVTSTVSYALDMQLCGVTNQGQIATRGNAYFYVMEDEAELLYTNQMLIRALALDPSGDGYLGSLGNLYYYFNIDLVRD